MIIDEELNKINYNMQSISDVCLVNNINVNPKKEFPNSNFEYISISDVDGNLGKITNKQEYIGENAPSRAKRKLLEGDVIVSTVRPYLKSFARVTDTFNDAICSSGFAVLTPDESKINTDYLFFAVRSPLFVNQLKQKQRGANYPAVGIRDIKPAKIPVPSLEEQERIVSYIERELNWVEELEKSTSLLRAYFTEYKKSLLNTVFTGSKNITKQTHKITKNDIPENWKMGNIGENVDFQSGKAFKSNDYIDKSDSSILCFRVSNYTPEGKLKLDDCSYLPKKFINKYQSVLLHNNDVLITMVGASCGKMYYVDKEGLPALLNQNMWRLRCNKDTIIQRYLYYYLKSCQDYIKNTTNGSARKYLTQKKIKDISIPLPSIEKQRNICKNLDNKFSYIDSHIDIIDNLEENLTEYKESVLSSAFKGDISN